LITWIVTELELRRDEVGYRDGSDRAQSSAAVKIANDDPVATAPRY